MNYCLSLVLATALLTTTTDSGATAVIGAGNADCALALQAGNGKIPEDAVQWAMGYLTGLSATEPTESPLHRKLLQKDSVDLVAPGIAHFCKQFPRQSLREATWAIYKFLGGQRDLRQR